MKMCNIKFKSIVELTPLLTTFLSVVVVVVAGWWYNQTESRKFEMKKEVRGYRLEMLHSIITLHNDFDKNIYLYYPRS